MGANPDAYQAAPVSAGSVSSREGQEGRAWLDQQKGLGPSELMDRSRRHHMDARLYKTTNVKYRRIEISPSRTIRNRRIAQKISVWIGAGVSTGCDFWDPTWTGRGDIGTMSSRHYKNLIKAMSERRRRSFVVGVLVVGQKIRLVFGKY